MALSPSWAVPDRRPARQRRRRRHVQCPDDENGRRLVCRSRRSRPRWRSSSIHGRPALPFRWSDAAPDRHRLWRRVRSISRLRHDRVGARVFSQPPIRHRRKPRRWLTTGSRGPIARAHRRDRRGSDLGPVQCRLCHDLQLRTLDAGRARLVDIGGRIGHQHRVVAGGDIRSRSAAIVADRTGRPNWFWSRLHRLRDTDGRCRAAAR